MEDRWLPMVTDIYSRCSPTGTGVSSMLFADAYTDVLSWLPGDIKLIKDVGLGHPFL